MPTCKEVAREIASDSGRRQSWLHRFGVRLHLLMCRHCRAYAREIATLGHLARRLCNQSEEDEVALRGLEAKILEEFDGEPPH